MLYSEIVESAQKLTDTTGQTDVQEVAEEAAVHALRYIASRIKIPELMTSKTYTWQSADEVIPIGVGGFAITGFTTPVQLFVNDIPYTFRDWLEWKTFQKIPYGERWSLNQPATSDIRPWRCYTINPDDEVEIFPLPIEDDEIELFYDVEPAAYNGASSPELNTRYHVILVNACILAIKEFLKKPSTIVDLNTLFSSLDPQISELEMHQNSHRQRRGMRVSHRYRV